MVKVAVKEPSVLCRYLKMTPDTILQNGALSQTDSDSYSKYDPHALFNLFSISANTPARHRTFDGMAIVDFFSI